MGKYLKQDCPSCGHRKLYKRGRDGVIKCHNCGKFVGRALRQAKTGNIIGLLLGDIPEDDNAQCLLADGIDMIPVIGDFSNIMRVGRLMFDKSVQDKLTEENRQKYLALQGGDIVTGLIPPIAFIDVLPSNILAKQMGLLKRPTKAETKPAEAVKPVEPPKQEQVLSMPSVLPVFKKKKRKRGVR